MTIGGICRITCCPYARDDPGYTGLPPVSVHVSEGPSQTVGVFVLGGRPFEVTLLDVLGTEASRTRVIVTRRGDELSCSRIREIAGEGEGVDFGGYFTATKLIEAQALHHVALSISCDKGALEMVGEYVEGTLLSYNYIPVLGCIAVQLFAVLFPGKQVIAGAGGIKDEELG